MYAKSIVAAVALLASFVAAQNSTIDPNSVTLTLRSKHMDRTSLARALTDLIQTSGVMVSRVPAGLSAAVCPETTPVTP